MILDKCSSPELYPGLYLYYICGYRIQDPRMNKYKNLDWEASFQKREWINKKDIAKHIQKDQICELIRRLSG